MRKENVRAGIFIECIKLSFVILASHKSPIGVRAAPLLSQLPANNSERAAKDVLSARAAATHVRDLWDSRLLVSAWLSFCYCGDLKSGPAN